MTSEEKSRALKEVAQRERIHLSIQAQQREAEARRAVFSKPDSVTPIMADVTTMRAQNEQSSTNPSDRSKQANKSSMSTANEDELSAAPAAAPRRCYRRDCRYCSAISTKKPLADADVLPQSREEFDAKSRPTGKSQVMPTFQAQIPAQVPSPSTPATTAPAQASPIASAQSHEQATPPSRPITINKTMRVTTPQITHQFEFKVTFDSSCLRHKDWKACSTIAQVFKHAEIAKIAERDTISLTMYVQDTEVIIVRDDKDDFEEFVLTTLRKSAASLTVVVVPEN
ncbi:hypothetical protein LTR66_016802 [Elasticomyces elasticus]|nr:hypothetical protein LTR66_016802 [Elasticomyces elasticus]